jgi:hypothetical protein
LSKAIPRIVGAFENYGIAYRLREQNIDQRYFGGWVDILDLSYKNRPIEETEALFSHCVYPGAFRCFAIFGDKAYICGVYLRCKTIGIISDNPDEYVDFSEDGIGAAEKRKEQILKFYDRKYFSACEYCDGFCESSKRYLPAEQL